MSTTTTRSSPALTSLSYYGNDDDRIVEPEWMNYDDDNYRRSPGQVPFSDDIRPARLDRGVENDYYQRDASFQPPMVRGDFYQRGREDDYYDSMRRGGRRGGGGFTGQSKERLKSFGLGGVVALWSAAPFTALHLLLLESDNTNMKQMLPQWEFDTGAAFVQGAFFALIYRKMIRQDVPRYRLSFPIINAACWIRALSRVHVPKSCTALPLHCK
jgi:hypothetical protein